MALESLLQFVVPLVAALLGGAGVHIWHKSNPPSAPAAPAAPATPARPGVPLPVPEGLFPTHPLLSHLVSLYGDRLEAALLEQFQAKLGLNPQAEPAAPAKS